MFEGWGLEGDGWWVGDDDEGSCWWSEGWEVGRARTLLGWLVVRREELRSAILLATYTTSHARLIDS